MSETLERYHQHSASPYAKKFGRVITAMITPFDADGQLNYREANELASYLLGHGSDSLVLAGTTGESPTLTHNEQRDLFEHIRSSTDNTLIAGTGSNSTEEAASLARYVTDHELADGLLVVSPYYNRPSQYGIQEYYHRIASETDLPIIAYNIPTRTGRAIEDRTLISLAADHPNIVGLKDAGGDTASVRELIESRDLPEDFVVYSGDDNRNLELAQAGAVGAISVASHWTGNRIQAMYAALDRNDTITAHNIHTSLEPDYSYESSNDAPNPQPTKTLLHEAGLISSDYARPPMSIHPKIHRALAQQARALLR